MSSTTRERVEALVKLDQVEEALVEFVSAFDYVSYVEIQRAFSQFMPTTGTGILRSDLDRNVIFWVGLSDRLLRALTSELVQTKIERYPTVPLVYAADGAILQLPVVDKVAADRALKTKDKQFPEPHWYPCVLRLRRHDTPTLEQTDADYMKLIAEEHAKSLHDTNKPN